MIALTETQTVIAGAVLAVFLIAGGWMLYAGLRARSAARAIVIEQIRLARLVEMSPAAAMIVRADGRVELPRRLMDWLGLSSMPRDLTELAREGEGLEPEHAAQLAREVLAAQKGGKQFTISVRAQGAGRTLLVQGRRAADDMQVPGGVVLWFFDATENEGRIVELERQRSQLRAAFDALTGLIEVAPMPMWYRGSDLRLLMVNSAYVAAVEGEDAEQVVEQGVELIEGAGMGGPLANAAIARDTNEPQIAAMPATIGGERRAMRLYDVPLPGGGVAGFAIDVEDLEQARGGLRRFAEAQRAMLDRLSAGVAQFGADRSLSFVNQPFRRIFGIRNEWLAERPEFDRVLDRMREANRLPEVRDFPGWKAELRDWFHVEDAVEENWDLPGGMHLRVVGQPLPDGGLLLVFEDRTEQMKLTSAHDTLLRVRTATFDNLVEALGVFAGARLQLWNNKFRQVWGVEEALLASHPHVDQLISAVSTTLKEPGHARLIGELVRAAIERREQRGGQLVFKDGRHFQVAAVPLPDGNALFTMLDVTDSHRIERALRDRNEALEAADRVKTAFVANMSYELRTPLTSIQGFAEMLHGGFAGDLSSSGTEYAEAILDSVARLSSLVDDVLDLTGDEHAPVTREPVDLELIAQAAAEAVAPLVRERRTDLAVEVDGSAGQVPGEARRLRQAVEHLLRHAITNTQPGGRVLLHIDGTKARARIIVSDDGPGLSKAAAARAFDRFAHGRVSRDGERPLGLGLPLAKQFVEAHGGTIGLLSEPGEGTMITIELPRKS